MYDSSNKKVYIISGPTASGKSEVAYQLAKRIDGEIVNCDSVQLYKYMDIGSAKPTDAMMQSVKHHLFDIVDPDYPMTVAKYQQLALTTINDILSRGKTPILVGGTGLYINSILYKMEFAGKEPTYINSKRRLELEQMASDNGPDYMHNYLSGLDPDSAERIHPNNIRKIIRAIEAFEMGDNIKSMDNLQYNSDYDFKFYILNMDREELYNRINNRVLYLIQNGLIEEVKDLVNRGYDLNTPSMKSIGYKEILAYLNGEMNIRDAIEEIMKNTRHYAKRQLTWFKRYDNATWLIVKENEPISGIIDQISSDSE